MKVLASITSSKESMLIKNRRRDTTQNTRTGILFCSQIAESNLDGVRLDISNMRRSFAYFLTTHEKTFIDSILKIAKYSIILERDFGEAARLSSTSKGASLTEEIIPIARTSTQRTVVKSATLRKNPSLSLSSNQLQMRKGNWADSTDSLTPSIRLRHSILPASKPQQQIDKEIVSEVAERPFSYSYSAKEEIKLELVVIEQIAKVNPEIRPTKRVSIRSMLQSSASKTKNYVFGSSPNDTKVPEKRQQNIPRVPGILKPSRSQNMYIEKELSDAVNGPNTYKFSRGPSCGVDQIKAVVFSELTIDIATEMKERTVLARQNSPKSSNALGRGLLKRLFPQKE